MNLHSTHYRRESQLHMRIAEAVMRSGKLSENFQFTFENISAFRDIGGKTTASD